MLFVVAIVVWEARSSRFFGVKRFILPPPSAIWAALVDNWTAGYQILDGAQVTLTRRSAGSPSGTAGGSSSRSASPASPALA